MAYGGIELPDVQEFSKSELMQMEREVTGLYLSGHPMDEYRAAVRRAGAVAIGEVLNDFAQEGGNTRFADDQHVKIAGVIEDVKTKPTRNNSIMAYLTLDDGSGSIELLAFQRVIDDSGNYMQTNAPIIVGGRLSARDEKEPQIVVETLRPITDAEHLIAKDSAPKRNPANAGETPTHTSTPTTDPQSSKPDRTLYVKLTSEDSAEYERLKLVHMMFPGQERMVIHFSDTKKTVGAKCIIHNALITELQEMLGEKNVVVKD